ncbi:MAG: prepilin peptidase [Firmicutes bacterium]|nr:prepilin peptidase [Bacillota bacterium]
MLVTIIFFIFGLIFGSFFQVVGLRLPKGESIIKPASHCTNCDKKLKWYELIPILSYIIQSGKCRNCNKHISIKYPLYELLTGICFALCYVVFGFTTDIIIPLTLVSALIIVIISDIEYMIIPDEVLFIGTVLILIETIILKGWNSGLHAFIGGLFGFILMYVIKLAGDFIFKAESLGGGDIKLFFMLGLVFNFDTIVVILFLASFFALPYAISIMLMKKDNVVPYGPFISLTAISLILLKTTNLSIIELLNYLV